MTNDQDYLRLLAIFHYVVGGLCGLCACIPIFHLSVGIGLVSGAFTPPSGPPPPAAFGWLFIVVATVAIVTGWALAVGLVVAGWMLQQRRAYYFCLVMAGVACLFQPFGTVLGILTIVVLARPQAKALFDRARPYPNPEEAIRV